MEPMAMLDRISAAVERVLKDAPPRRHRMGPEALVAYALAQIQKAADEPAEQAKRRLEALGRTVGLAKQSFVDSASEEIEVQVFEEETTARADDSEREISPVAAQSALGNVAFASNPEDLNKALAQLARDLEGLRGKPQAGPAAVEKVDAATADWPPDMNRPEFREGVHKAEDAPTWGYDPGREPPKA